jgi:hypothetical protein
MRKSSPSGRESPGLGALRPWEGVRLGARPPLGGHDIEGCEGRTLECDSLPKDVSCRNRCVRARQTSDLSQCRGSSCCHLETSLSHYRTAQTIDYTLRKATCQFILGTTRKHPKGTTGVAVFVPASALPTVFQSPLPAMILPVLQRPRLAPRAYTCSAPQPASASLMFDGGSIEGMNSRTT